MVPYIYASTQRTLNKAIMQKHYKAPALEKISHQLCGATFFSKLDAKDGFLKIHLNENSSYLTTFTTHHGRCRFLHIPFNLKISQDIFHMHLDQVTDHLPSIIAFHDDICVYGHTPEEHDQHLLQLMRMASQHGIIFNSSRCQIKQLQIAFYSADFAVTSMMPDPSKIQALQDLPTPDCPVKLQSFLGLINYLHLFIAGLAAKTMLLCDSQLSATRTP